MRLIRLLTILIVALAVVSCGDNLRHKSMITVSIQPQRFMLEKIVGDRFEVSCMLNEGNNPEAYEPSMNHLMNIEHSVAYFCIGYIGFEDAMVTKAQINNPDLKIYDNGKGIEVIMGTHHSPDGHHHEADPHIWSSVENAKVISKNMLDAVVELDPDNAKTYTANYDKWMTELQALGDTIAAELAPRRGEAFLVWHPSLSYFARDYGLRQLSLEYEGKEIPIDRLKANIDSARQSGARVLFLQQEFDSRQLEAFGAELAVKVVKINPMSYEWMDEMRNTAAAIANV